MDKMSSPLMNKPRDLWTEQSWDRWDADKSRGRGQTAWYKLGSFFVRKGDSVLDMGCGMGRTHGEILSRSPGKLVGVDVRPEVLRLVELQGPNHSVSSMEDIEGKTFEVVLSIDVIEHVADDLTFLRTLRGLTSGVLVISTPNYCVSKCRSKWHCREYTPASFEGVIREVFPRSRALFGAVSGREAASGSLDNLVLRTTISTGRVGASMCAVVFI